MHIQYVANGSRRTVRDSVGRELVGRGIAREMRSDEPSQDEQTQATTVQSTAKPAKAPNTAIGVPSSTLKGRAQLSYCAARIRNTNTSDMPKIAAGGTPSAAFFSWYDMPE